MSEGNKPVIICPHEDIQLVSKEDPSLGFVGVCKKLQGHCAYFDNPEEFKKINSDHQNCFIFNNFK